MQYWLDSSCVENRLVEGVSMKIIGGPIDKKRGTNFEYVLMLQMLHDAGARVELQNHLSDKKKYTWSCTVSNLNKKGYRTTDTANRNWWRFWGESPIIVIEQPYNKRLAAGEK